MGADRFPKYFLCKLIWCSFAVAGGKEDPNNIEDGERWNARASLQTEK